MICRRYKKEDYGTVSIWHFEHTGKAIPEGMLPKTGFIVEGVAAGFVYKTDSEIGFIEGFVSNKRAKGKDKIMAFDMIAEALVKEAEKVKITKLVAFTIYDSIKRVGLRAGFVPNGDYLCLVKGV